MITLKGDHQRLVFLSSLMDDGELLLNTNPQNKSSNVNYNKNKTKTSVLHHKFVFSSWGNSFRFLTLEAKL